MERKNASDFPQELLDLFHEYVHGEMSRRGFMDRASKFAVGGLTTAAVVTAAMGLFLIQPLRAEVIEKTKKVGDTTVQYKIVLPDNYDPAKAYPAVLVMGGGPQNMNTVNNILARNFRAEAEKRGYIIVGPAAPDDDLFFEPSHGFSKLLNLRYDRN